MGERFGGRARGGVAALLIAATVAGSVMGWPTGDAGRALGRHDGVLRTSVSGNAGDASDASGTSVASAPAVTGTEVSTAGGAAIPPLPILDKPDGGSQPSGPTPAPELPSGHETTWEANVPRGAYRALIDVRADQPGRVDVIHSGHMVGTYVVGSTVRTLEALLFVDGPASRIGVRSSSPVQLGARQLTPIGTAFTTRGTQIIDPSGQVFRFRGVNRSGYQLAPSGTPSLNQFGHESEAMWRWGVNAVRLPMNQEFWHANCEVPASSVHATPQRPDGTSWRYHDVIDEEVRRFTERGIMVLLDLAATSRGEVQGCSADGEVLREMPDERSLAFWRSVAARYKNQPYVAFDLFNEPHLHDSVDPPSEAEAQRIWRNGGHVTYRDKSGLVPTNTTYNAIGMQALYQAVRAVGATNLVFVAGLHYAHRPEVLIQNPLDASGMVASVHLYCLGCSQIPRPEQVEFIDGERPGQPNRLGVTDRYAAAATEFGTDEWWDGSDNRRYIEYFSSRGMGWTVWTWAGGGTGFGRTTFGILAEATQSAPSRTPGPAGVPVWDSLADVRAARGL